MGVSSDPVLFWVGQKVVSHEIATRVTSWWVGSSRSGKTTPRVPNPGRVDLLSTIILLLFQGFQGNAQKGH